MIESDVQGYGNLAQAWVRDGARFGVPRDLREWQGVDAFTLLRHGERWEITSVAWAATED